MQKNRTGVFSAHQMGTCRMGADEWTSVCDGEGQCWHVSGLYLADASVFPTPSGILHVSLSISLSRSVSLSLSRSRSLPLSVCVWVVGLCFCGSMGRGSAGACSACICVSLGGPTFPVPLCVKALKAEGSGMQKYRTEGHLDACYNYLGCAAEEREGNGERERERDGYISNCSGWSQPVHLGLSNISGVMPQV
jgi:hypothetical protein